ncbi:MAG: sugar ABC transporter ATP-binding protein [Clostridia bacterium]
MSEIVLSLRGITKRYPGVIALDQVSVDFKRGEIHALLGENGAGKSTLIKAVAGALIPDEGEIIIDGVSHTCLTPLEAKQANIEVIYQEFNLVDSLMVAENICCGERKGRLVHFKQMEKQAQEVLDRMGIHNLSTKTVVGLLPPSQKQLVEIAKSISRNAKILIMDEPSAPLSISEVNSMFRIVRKLKDDGVTIIYISHRMEELFEISDRVTVMRDGKYVTTKVTAETNAKELIALMVGRELNESYPRKSCLVGEEVLRVEKLCGSGDHDISFTLHKGEIVGLAGLVGAGRTELARLIFGADKIESGHVYVQGKEVHCHLPSQAIAYGIGLIPEDRKQDGCFLEKPIDWNCSIANIRTLSCHGVVDCKQEAEQAKAYQQLLNIKTPSLQQLTQNLSGGNQQKVVLAKTLATNSAVLIFDEPTRGIDVGAKQEIYTLMCKLAEEGKAILMITSDMQELLGMSDRILVLFEGCLAGELSRMEASQDKVMELASGLVGNT